MAAIPWWGWLLALVATIVLVGAAAARSWRARVRREFVAFLRREAPDVEVVAERRSSLDVRLAAGEEGTLRLRHLFTHASKLKADDTAGREAAFAACLAMLREGRDAWSLVPERDRERLRPRLADEGLLSALCAENGGESLPSVPTLVPGLAVVFVIDSPHSVMYVTTEQLGQLGLTLAEALELAKQNLAPSFDKRVVQGALAGADLNVVKCQDTYDAARLLLLPDCLSGDERVVALIPDRDTLIVTGVPDGDGWSGLRRLARTADGAPLWTEPLLVTAAGIASCP